MNLRHLEYFLAVADEGSISRAAESLHMTQPPLSQAVLGLEKSLGATLLVRHAKGVSLTEAGRLLADQARQFLRWGKRIEERVAEVGAGLAGRLHIAAVPTFAWSHLPPILQAFAERAPGVELELTDPRPAEVLRQVAAGAFDVGFVATADPAGVAAAHPELTVEGLVAMPLRLVLPPNCADAPDPLDLNTVKHLTWLLPQTTPGFPGLEDIAIHAWQRARIRPRTVRYVATLQTAVPLITADLGVSLMPDSISDMAGGRVHTRNSLQPVDPLWATMVWSPRLTPSPALQRFLDTTRATIGPAASLPA